MSCLRVASSTSMPRWAVASRISLLNGSSFFQDGWSSDEGRTASAQSVGATQPGDLRLYAAGTGLPLASTINYSANQTRANNAFVPLGATGQLAVRLDQAAGSVQVILDVNGYVE